jgi:hypothetical protein
MDRKKPGVCGQGGEWLLHTVQKAPQGLKTLYRANVCLASALSYNFKT